MLVVKREVPSPLSKLINTSGFFFEKYCNVCVASKDYSIGIKGLLKEKTEIYVFWIIISRKLLGRQRRGESKQTPS